MSLAAYKRVAQVTETARQTECRLLGDVCRELNAVSKAPYDERRRREALDWNRRVWTTFMLDCGQAENPLPIRLRAQIVSLGLWVYRFSEEAMSTGADLQPLIEVNGSIIKGLLGNPNAS
jgi:flagellar biosynthesis activator protein FlaF